VVGPAARLVERVDVERVVAGAALDRPDGGAVVDVDLVVAVTGVDRVGARSE
jgi:hypothetical protein